MVQGSAGKRPVPKREADDKSRMLHLITAAEDVFLTQGYHAATMNDVAKAAGMSKKTIYQLIDSKEQLFGALLAHQQSQVQFPTPDPSWTTREVLAQNLLALGRAMLSPKQVALTRLIMAEYTHSPAIGRVFHQMRVVKIRGRIEHCISGARTCSSIKETDLREISALLFGAALGEFILGILIGFRPMPTQATLKRRIIRAVDLFLQ